jgi:general secretion pathway protein J
MKRAPIRRRLGFTLIELLVAISVLAVVAVLGWRGLDGIVRARIALGAQMEQTRGMQLAFAQMQSDCDHLADGKLLHQRANLATDPDRLTLVRTVFAENEPGSLQVVAYRIRNGVLTRRESAATRDLAQLDTLWKAALSDLDTAVGVVLQTGVSGMAMRKWNGSEWQAESAPDAPGQTQLLQRAPLGLEVALYLQGQQVGLVKIFLLGAV